MNWAVPPYVAWAEHAAMTPEQKAAHPSFQAFLPALKPGLIFECVGVPGVLQQVFEGASRGARIVVVGVCMESDRSEPMLGVMKELSVQYVFGYTPDEFAFALRLIAEGQVDAASLVTATVGIDGVAQAFVDLANPERHTKIIIQPSSEGERIDSPRRRSVGKGGIWAAVDRHHYSERTKSLRAPTSEAHVQWLGLATLKAATAHPLLSLFSSFIDWPFVSMGSRLMRSYSAIT